MKHPHPALPLAEASVDEIARKLCFASALELCAEVAGYSLDKQSCAEIGMDKARWSRIKAGQEGIKWEQLQQFMDACGNDAPLLWMVHQRGYDLHSMHRRQSETERKLKATQDELEALKRQREIELATMQRLLGRVA
ncbi:MAG TPA: hypothetical protein VFY12_11085 [Arenimonas sp.]|nr:hypothetical protein [Arenimonas sp.]